MRPSSPWRTGALRFAPLFVSLSLALLAFTPTARAGTVPVPSPGPSNVPLAAPGGGVVSLSGTLMAALIVALSVLVVVVAARDQRILTAGTGRVSLRLIGADGSVDHAQDDHTAMPASSGRAEEERRKLAA